MVTDETLLLLLAYGGAPLFLVGCAALQNKVRQFQQVVADGYHGYGPAPLRFPAARNAPEFLAQVALFHARNRPRAFRQSRTQPAVSLVGVTALATAGTAVVTRTQPAPGGQVFFVGKLRRVGSHFRQHGGRVFPNRR